MTDLFRISKDVVRARDLYEMALERLNEIIVILPKDKPYKILEEYYEVIVQLGTAIMYADGFKTLSHVTLIGYISKNYKEFNSGEIKTFDEMRKLRHGAVYYGQKVQGEFLINHEESIKEIIEKLVKIVEVRING